MDPARQFHTAVRASRLLDNLIVLSIILLGTLFIGAGGKFHQEKFG